MYVEEERKLETLVEDVPVGGVFKSISGKTLMKMLPEQDIKAIDLSNGIIYNFHPDAKVDYFANAKVVLKR